MAGEMATTINNGKRQKNPFLWTAIRSQIFSCPASTAWGFSLKMKLFALVSALTPFAQKQVNAGQYGPGMSELEKQIAEHNILQKEIEAYGLQIKNLRSGVRHPLSPPCSCHPLGTLLVPVPPAPPHSECPPLFCTGMGAREVAPGWFLKHIP